MGRIGGRGDLRLVEGHGNHLMAAQVANVAQLNHEIVARLVLEVQREVDAVGQLVGAIVDAESKWLLRIGTVTVPSIIWAALGK